MARSRSMSCNRVGKYCKLWPEVEDHCFYYDVIKIINAPIVAGSRGNSRSDPVLRAAPCVIDPSFH